MISILEFHDSYTKGHSIGVANISEKMSEYMKLSEETLNELYLTALLHDIGKIFIDAEILNKKTPLTDQEYKIIKKHPEKGCRYFSKHKNTKWSKRVCTLSS